MKNKLLLFLLWFTLLFNLHAQETRVDSTVIKLKLIKKDIRQFYLNKQDWITCRKQHFKPTSDYFKPNISNISNPTLLSDSDYVKAFRVAAYKKIKSKRTILRVEATGWVLYGIVFTALVIIILPIVLKFK